MKTRALKTLLLSAFIFIFAISTKKVAHQILLYGFKKEQNTSVKISETQEVTQIKIDRPTGLNWGLHQIDLYETRISNPQEVIVAVIDTGVDMDHELLKEQLWVNPGESGIDEFGNNKENNGIDDDENGYIDDVNGWNFVDHDHNLLDYNGHGTHISGIIAAKTNKNIRGVAPNAKLMILKYYSPHLNGKQNLKNTVQAIEYATRMGAKIINYSAGGTLPSQEEKMAIKKASLQNILFIAAAGNNSENSDIRPFYPADYNLPNILSVTAINKKRKVLPSSNFGSNSVDIAAPGNKIYSTLPGNKYGFLTGTSQATAFVTGLAALTWGTKNYYKTPDEVINHLIGTGKFEQNLLNKSKNAKVLNSKRSIAMASLYSDAFGLRNHENNELYNFKLNQKEKKFETQMTLTEKKSNFSLPKIKSWFFDFF